MANGEIGASDKFHLTDRFIMARVGDEAVLARVSASAADLGSLTALNRTGAAILDALKEGCDVGGAVERLVDRYGEESREAVERDARAFIGQMLSQGVIEPAG